MIAPSGAPFLTATTVEAIRDIPAADWDRCAFADGSGNPFVSHGFLNALEESGSVGAAAGWRPRHLVLKQGAAIVGVAPLYLKSHSFGEYVFDQGWAEAYERAGGRYYPKLLGAVPFTPVPGPRLLAADEAARAGLAEAIRKLTESGGLSSAHLTFIGESDAPALAGAGYLERVGVQFHWTNRGYRSFDDFLESFASRKRKAIRRERREALEGDVAIRRIDGAAVSERDWDWFWRFYQDTGARKWGRPYLTRSFFSLIGDRLADRIVLFFAERNGTPIAGALNFRGADALFGRYWGCLEEQPFLHFELCYHQAVEYAIEMGLSRVEAGAQGEHKLARGYEPVVTRSAHYLPDDGFRMAVARFLDAEKAHILREQEALSTESPFKKSRAPDDRP